MRVMLVLFDQLSLKSGESISKRIKSYIDDNYVESATFDEYGFTEEDWREMSRLKRRREVYARDRLIEKNGNGNRVDGITDIYEDFHKPFTQKVFELTDKRGIKDSELYGGKYELYFSKQILSNMRKDPDYHPSKYVSVVICLVLKLNLYETLDLLERAGFTLSRIMLNEMNFIGFYHENEEYGCFSNWYPSEFEYAGKKYANIEQYMMYQKMRTFAQYEIADRIMETTDPAECKKLGRSHIDNWNGELWDKISYAIVKRGIKAKFFQNKDLLEKLLNTGDILLAECAPNDTKWGIGIAVDDPRRFDIKMWTGQNLLGRILMDIREELRLLAEISYKRLMHSVSSFLHRNN